MAASVAYVAGLEDLERDPSRSRAATDPKPTESQSGDETTETPYRGGSDS